MFKKLTNRRVLVVEDEALIALLMAEALLDADAIVVGPAATVAEALTLVESEAANGALDAAVLDLNLAGERVSPVADRLVALGIPVVFATGYGDDADVGDHTTAPVLQKPFDPDALVAAIGRIMRPGTARQAERTNVLYERPR
jgi:CheY-like chemotaxis protein